MTVLVACEESQVVCEAFRKRGHEAYSCDIQWCSGGHPEWHINGDVLLYINPLFYELDMFYGIRFYTCDGCFHEVRGKWDLILAFPPCTFITKASACRMYPQAGVIDPARYEAAMRAKAFFMAIYNADCDRIAIENPVPLKCVGLMPATQKIQPYEYDIFGVHPYSKATLLWLKNLPLLLPTTPHGFSVATWVASNTSGFSKGRRGSCGIARSAKERSKTFVGIAEAMAEQWG